MHDNLPAYAKGVLGEAAVCDRLTDGGMELLERRFRSPFGEIDLIMLDGDVLAFVEVKLRTRGGTEAGQAAVTPLKRRRMVEAAPLLPGRAPGTCGPLRTLRRGHRDGGGREARPGRLFRLRMVGIDTPCSKWYDAGRLICKQN